MPNITIKGIPEETYNLLKQRAKLNRRSLNSEIILTLEQATEQKTEQTTEQRRAKMESLLKEIKAMHQKMKLPPLTDEFLKEAKNEGRL